MSQEKQPPIPLTPNSRSYITHFSQPDSIIPDLYNPQSLNRYAYVGNNPINLNDPTGHMPTEGCGEGKSACAPTTPVDNCLQITDPIARAACEGDGGDIENPKKGLLMHWKLIGSFSSWQPYLMDSSDSSCGNCSEEPAVPDYFTPLIIAFGYPQNIVSMAQKADIYVYMNYYKGVHSSIVIPSLTIDNRSAVDLSVMSVQFTVTDTTGHYIYSVRPETQIGPSDTYFGVRTGGNQHSITVVNLTPSGVLGNYYNSFGNFASVQIAVEIANSKTGYYYPMNPFSFTSIDLENK